jgi:hypothetical protein
MWVFDGEEWTQDEGAEQKPVSQHDEAPRHEELIAELQLVEVTSVRRSSEKPPFPPR